ncbi:hypothetical protein Tco_1164491 [Tanacetum coccineum]
MKPLPDHPEYAYLEKDSLLLVIIASNLKADEKKRLINFKDNAKPIIQRQRRLNPNMKEVVKKEIIKLLDSSIIYPLEDSPWFDIEIINKKGAENVAAYHLLCLENPNLEELREDKIDDNFLDEILMKIENHKEEIPWFADFANYLVGNIRRKCLTYAQHRKVFSDLKYYFWEEPYLFKMCPDEMKRRCVHGAETQKILDESHHGPTGGQYRPSTTAKKVFDVGFY